MRLVCQIIGRVKQLTLLNGSRVSPVERNDCELRYLNLATADRDSSNSTKNDVAERHPRLAELLEKYGDVR